MSKRFRTAFVLEKGKLNDMSALEPHAEEIKFLLSGEERSAEIAHRLHDNFMAFDPNLDVLIPTGRVISSFMFGYLMGFATAFYIGIYRDKNYDFLRIWQNMFVEIPNV